MQARGFAPPDAGQRVGETRAAGDFFAGRYDKVVSETFDAPAMNLPEADVAFAVGALAFLGRVDDAQACFDGWRARSAKRDERTLAASRFFLGVAYARAGDFQRAWELLVSRARARLRVDDPWAASFACQGLACHRYFTGRYRAAARHARRALRAAHVARFAYVQMLSNDLRGHALVQLGQLSAGTALLEQAKTSAVRLGFGANAHAIECSIAVYDAKFKTGSDATSGLDALLARGSHDSYSRRALLTQAAIQHALHGRGRDALRVLEEADHDALRVDGRRAKVTSLLARLYVTRFSRGARGCTELLDQASSLTEQGDVGFRAELLSFQLSVARALRDARRTELALDALRSFRRSAEHYAATAAVERYAPDRAPAFAEDELTPLLRAAEERDTRALPRLLALGLLGPVPELLGLEPARRVILLPCHDALLIEDHGDLWARSGPPRWVAPLLRLLARASASKEAIVAELWGLRRYRPERHDPLVRTTIHRLRAFLDPRGDWVTVTADGYGLAVGVRIVGAESSSVLLDAAPSNDHHVVFGRAPLAAAVERSGLPVDRLVLERVVLSGAASAPEIARALELSESTVLRALRRLVRARSVRKTGSARATRYRARAG